MKPRRAEVRRGLARLAATPVPAADGAFAARLEGRLRAVSEGEAGTFPEPTRARRMLGRRALPRWVAVVGAAAACVAALTSVGPLAAHHDDRTTNVGSTGSTPATGSRPATTGTVDGNGDDGGRSGSSPTTLTEPPAAHDAGGAVATTVPPTPMTSPSGGAGAGSGGNAADRSTTTTRPALPVPPVPTTAPEPAPTTTTTPPPPASTSTTSTTARPVQTFTFGCASSTPNGQPTVSCSWSRYTGSGFASYRLRRATLDGPWQVVYTTTNVTGSGTSDKTVLAGGTYRYIVEALDANGQVIGAGPQTTVSCCNTI